MVIDYAQTCQSNLCHYYFVMRTDISSTLSLIDFLFQIRYLSDDDSEQQLLPQWLGEYDNHYFEIMKVCSSDPKFGEVFQRALNTLCQDVLRKCFDFYYESDNMRLFVSDTDTIYLMDMLYLDAIVGTMDKFLEAFFEYYNTWKDHPKVIVQRHVKVNPAKKVESKSRPNIPREARNILEAWFRANVDNPYPKARDKEHLCTQTGLTIKKVDNWFINERSRKWHLYKKDMDLH